MVNAKHVLLRTLREFLPRLPVWLGPFRQSPSPTPLKQASNEGTVSMLNVQSKSGSGIISKIPLILVYLWILLQTIGRQRKINNLHAIKYS
jgi:hypothetical protein